ncbi:ABC transporter ATP-binding protein/permease [Pendulispora rubella]|uniref:ABC transporter ATP-binding protein/permease n=1 Tax=Pendulispora rubella TaxID=2741070 RepID=A0ABZ2LJK8_9BACT
MSPAIESFAWPLSRVGEALEAIARATRVQVDAPPPPAHADLEDAARTLGLEVESLHVRYADIDAMLGSVAPALLRISMTSRSAEQRVVALLDTRGKSARIIASDHAVRTVPLAAIHDALCVDAERAHGARIESLVARIPLSSEERLRARAALLRERVSTLSLDAGWALRVSPATSFLHQLRSAGIIRMLGAMSAAHAASFALSLIAWWVIGRGALSGHLDRGWLYAWVLLLVTFIPIRVLATWWQGFASVLIGLRLKRRMLLGALNMSADAVRGQGTGQLLGRVIEVDAVEELTMRGGFASLVALVELALAIPVLALGPSGVASVATFLTWLAFAAFLVRRFAHRWLAWSSSRIAMTNDMVEGMLGHRTRVAQEDPSHWHDAEDSALATYAESTRHLDRTNMLIVGLLPRGWLLLGFASIAPSFVAGTSSPDRLAVGIAGVLLARNSLVRLTTGITSLIGAFAAWKHAAPLFHAAGRAEPAASSRRPSTNDSSPDAAVGQGTALLDAHHLAFRYRDEGNLVLRDASFRVRYRDRILVEGPSGSGKSTLGSVLVGLRDANSGLVLLNGLDRKSVGTQAWRHAIAMAPQFHENHVLSETLAFNLLMGRSWPPRRDDLREAETICRELGLGPLLERMPGGLMQRVGETGWQLSHGERSRVYMARALLQGAELVILDETFASLDPETQAQALRCAIQRAPTLMVIAHP